MKPTNSLKKSRKKKPKDPDSISELRKVADRLVSIYVLYRDGELRVDGWYSQCFTCKKWVKLQYTKSGEIDRRSIHWGHFQSSRHNITRYNLKNVHAQCYPCNVHKQGEQYVYYIELEKKYGAGTAEILRELTQQKHPFTKEELANIIQMAQKSIDSYLKMV